jgi:hypothetical protein
MATLSIDQQTLRDLLALFDGWQAGVFKSLGVRYIVEPPAIRKARAILAAAGSTASTKSATSIDEAASPDDAA